MLCYPLCFIKGIRFGKRRLQFNITKSKNRLNMYDDTLSAYGIAGLVIVIAAGLSLLVAACWKAVPMPVSAPAAWAQFRFGYPVYALIFLAFDMEMIFMYPWAVVFADLGVSAFLDMLVFIALLAAGIAYAWRMDGLAWE